MNRSDTPQLPVDTAILVVLMACTRYDGHVAEAETRKLRSILLWSPIFAGNTTEEDDQLLAAAGDILSRTDLNHAVDLAVASLPAPLKTTALCFSFDMVYADGHVDDAEKEFLLVLAKKMQVPASIVEAIDLVTVARHAPG